jgi:hypothetical protein
VIGNKINAINNISSSIIIMHIYLK